MSVSSLTTLIVNADDFGYSEGVNRGILEAHEHGIVTSASLMSSRRAALQAAAYARHHDELDLGLHVDLRRWRVRWRPWSTGSERRLVAAVTRDVAEQLDRFRRLVGRDPTHLDSHHHRHRIESLRPVFTSVARELDIPLRQFDSLIGFRGDFYGQADGRPNPEAITPRALVELLEDLPSGVTELCSHPGYTDGLKDWYRDERVQEVRTLCDPIVSEAIDRLGITLTTFRELAAARESNPTPR
ncbi:MAG: ChbG/HpnK family deacetylase [Actinobacteria bacterium]|nr:ChbG/HpnK family deacetylase [Actinomycetota bacterium]